MFDLNALRQETDEIIENLLKDGSIPMPFILLSIMLLIMILIS